MADVTIPCTAVSRIITNLRAPGAPAETYRTRFEAIASGVPAFNVFPRKWDVRNQDAAHDATELDVDVVIRVYSASTQDADVALDPLILWAWRRVRADANLGGIAKDVYLDNIEIGYVDKDATDQVCADITIRVEMNVSRDDPRVNKFSAA